MKIITIDEEEVLVSPSGKIWIRKNDDLKELKQGWCGRGHYKRICIHRHTYYVHRVVAYAYGLYPSLDKIVGLDVDHIDNNNQNNNLSNLQVITSKENRAKEHANTLSKMNYHYEMLKIEESLKLVSIERSIRDIANKLGVDQSFISQVVNGKRKHVRGYVIRKVEEANNEI